MSNNKTTLSHFTFTPLPVYVPKTDLIKKNDTNIPIINNAKTTKTNTSKKDLKIRQLKEEFKLAMNEQGLFGKTWNGIKNIFKTEYSSSNIENELNKLSSSSSDKDIARVEKMIKDFRVKQDLAVDTTVTTCTVITVGATGAKVGGAIGTVLGSVVPGVGTLAGTTAGTALGFVGGAVVGAISNVIFNQVENMTDNIDNNSWHNDKNIKEELSSGAIAGTIMMISGGISNKVSGVCKHALGITKQGVAMTTSGTASVLKTISYSALSDATGGAVSSAMVSDGKYLIQCAIDDNVKFSTDNLLQTTIISGISGGVINGVFSGVQAYSTATRFNSNISEQVSEDVLNSTKESSIYKRGLGKTGKFVKKNVKSIVAKNLKTKFNSELKTIVRNNTPKVVKTPKPGIIYSNDNVKTKKIK